MKVHWSKSLVRIQACDEAREFCATQPSRQAAWDSCRRPDWLLFALDKRGALNERDWRLLTCALARTALPFAGETRDVCERTIEVAERFARGEASQQELSAAWSAAESTALSAARSAARSAAWSAALSAAGSAALSAASSAARSAAGSAAESTARSAAWSAARSAAWSAAESTALSAARSAACDVIRTMFPKHVLPALKTRSA